jgi:hypothetical protein
VLKLQSRKDEALEWYKKALLFNPRNREAARELADFGVDPVAVLHGRYSRHENVPHEWRKAAERAQIWIDVTGAWRAARNDGIRDRGDLWLLEMAIMLRDAGSKVLVCALDDVSNSYAALSKEAVEWLTAMAGGSTTLGRPDGLRPLPEAEGVFFMSGGSNRIGHHEWVTAVRELRARYRLTVAGVALSLAPLCRSELIEPFEAKSSGASLLGLVREAAVLIVSSSEEARRARVIANSLGFEIGTINFAHAFPPKISTSSGSSPGELGVYAVLAPQDQVEFDAVLGAWEKRERDSVLWVVSVDSCQKSLARLNSLILSRGLSPSSFEIVPPSVNVVRSRLVDCQSLLVPASRPDGVLWIQDALDLHVSVVSALSPRVMEWFGGYVEEYCDFSDVTELATRWLNRRSSTDHSRLHRQPARSLTKEAVMEVFRVCSPPEFFFGASPIDIGCFYSFIERPRTDGFTRDGYRFVAGSGTSNGVPGVRFVEKCQLRMLIREGFYDRFTYRCLLAGRPGDALSLSMSGPDNGCVEDLNWEIPQEGWGWATGNFSWGEDGVATLTISNLTSQVATEAAAGAVLGGIFLHPSAIDRDWFEFLDRLSRDLIPLPRFDSSTLPRDAVVAG